MALQLTDVTVASRALVLIGANPITAFDDGSTEAVVADTLYEGIIEGLLSERRWHFAKAQAEMDRLNDTPLAKWEAGYQAPPDALRVWAVYVNGRAIEFDFYDGIVFTNTSADDVVVAEYSFRCAESGWPADFALAAAYALASAFAGPLTQNGALIKAYAEKAELQLGKAKTADSQGRTTTKVETRSRLVAGRRTGRGG
jgi:hypothetical protein